MLWLHAGRKENAYEDWRESQLQKTCSCVHVHAAHFQTCVLRASVQRTAHYCLLRCNKKAGTTAGGSLKFAYFKMPHLGTAGARTACLSRRSAGRAPRDAECAVLGCSLCVHS